jgi:hypothetical protein
MSQLPVTFVVEEKQNVRENLERYTTAIKEENSMEGGDNTARYTKEILTAVIGKLRNW